MGYGHTACTFVERSACVQLRKLEMDVVRSAGFLTGLHDFFRSAQNLREVSIASTTGRLEEPGVWDENWKTFLQEMPVEEVSRLLPNLRMFTMDIPFYSESKSIVIKHLVASTSNRKW